MRNHTVELGKRNIGREQVVELVKAATMVGTSIGFQGQGAGRPIVVFKYHGEVMPISISVGTNGFNIIVSLNIVSKDLFLESDIDEDDLAEWP